MARNTVRLNNPNDINAIYGNPNVSDGTLVFGADGFQKIVLKSNPLNVTVDNSMERVDFSDFNLAELTFKPEGTSILVLNGSNTIAQISVNMNDGTQIACKNGGLTISYDNIDNPTAFVLKGADDASAKSLPFGSQESFIPDSSFNPNNTLIAEEGGNTPPTPSVTVVDVDGTYTIPSTGDYQIIGSVEKINAAGYQAVKGATSVTVRDTVDNLLADDGTVAPTAQTLIADDKVTEVRVQDTLANLIFEKMPDFGKTTKLQLTEALPTDGKINLTAPDEALTVQGKTEADALIKAFAARTDVLDVTDTDGTKLVTMPENLALGSYAIADTAAAISGATDTSIFTTANGCTGVTIEDTVAGIKAASLGSLSAIDNLNIEIADTLANLGTLTETQLSIIKSADASPTFTATDKATDGVVTADASGLANFNTTNGQIAFEDTTVTTVNLTASKALSSFSADTAFTTEALATLTAINITGSTDADTITASSKGGVIDGNGGADTITLGGAGADTVVLGSGVNLKESSGTVTLSSTNLASSDAAIIKEFSR